MNCAYYCDCIVRRNVYNDIVNHNVLTGESVGQKAGHIEGTKTEIKLQPVVALRR